MSAEFNTVMYRDVDSQLSVAYAALRAAVGFFLKLDRAKNQESGSDEKILEIVKGDSAMLWCVSAGMSGLHYVLKNGFGVDAEEDETFKIKSVSLLALTSTYLREDYKKEVAKKENNGKEETK
jgi:hypothetical protein